jgi:hypothetical protein
MPVKNLASILSLSKLPNPAFSPLQRPIGPGSAVTYDYLPIEASSVTFSITFCRSWSSVLTT